MLRSLINDADDKNFGQPKPLSDMSEDERRYVSVTASNRDRDWKRSRALRLREQFFEDVRVAIEQDITEPKQIAERLQCSEQKVVMTLREMRLID